MPAGCNHKSAGVLVWRNKKLLLIERGKFPPGFAAPAGHVDAGEAFEEAAKRELVEEVGLKTKSIRLLAEGRKGNNPCNRGSTWHYWKVYEVDTQGKVIASQSETKRTGWYSRAQIQTLAKRTEKYLADKIPEKEWERSPGLEVVWYEWFKELKII